jgi:hypothetical protein
MKINIPETAIHVSYLPWLARVDALIGEPARLDLARHTSFLAAWREGLSPHEAVADAKSRSMPHSPRWRMRWKQSASTGAAPAGPLMAGGGCRHFENASLIRQ